VFHWFDKLTMSGWNLRHPEFIERCAERVLSKIEGFNSLERLEPLEGLERLEPYR